MTRDIFPHHLLVILPNRKAIDLFISKMTSG